MTGSPWMPPGYVEPPIYDPWACDEDDCTAVAAVVRNGRATCYEHMEER